MTTETERRQRYLLPREVAEDLRLSVTTVYLMLGAPDGIPAIKVRGQWRVPADRYEAWRNGERPANPGVVVPITDGARRARRGR